MPSPKAELAVAIAGPLVNVVLVSVFLLLSLLTGAGEVALGLDVLGSLSAFFGAMVTINLGLAKVPFGKRRILNIERYRSK